MEQLKPETKDLTCFNEKISTRYSGRWGNRSADWMDFYDPHIEYPVFSADTGKAVLEVYADSLLLHSETISLLKGLSYYQYHLTMDESAKDDLLAFLKAKDPKSENEITQRDNEQYYLPKGKYKLVVSSKRQECSSSLEIK